MAEDNKNFMTSLPGILTGIAAVITAVATLWVTINSNKPDHTTVDPKTTVTQNGQQTGVPNDTTKPATQPGRDAQSGNQPVQPSRDSTSQARPLIDPGKLPALKPLPLKPLIIPSIYNLTAVIDDPDGFTNVRSKKSSTSQIVAKIRENERFYTYKQNESWWQVKTASGKVGYVHVSRIKILPKP